MRKSDEIHNDNSCLNKAQSGEYLFVLLARDAAAPTAIMKWVEERLRLGLNRIDDAQIRGAVQCADAMENQRKNEFKR